MTVLPSEVDPLVIVTPDTASGAGFLPGLWVAAVALFLLAAVAAFGPNRNRISALLSTAGSLCALALGVYLLAGGAALSGSGGDVLGFSPIAFRYDGLSGVFLVAFGASAAAASFSIVDEPARSRPEASAFPLFLASILLVLGASTAFSFLIAWESMALLSAFLVVGLRPTRAVVSAGNLYLAMTHVATAAILIGFGLLAAGSGGSLDFAAWHVAAPSLDPLTRNLVLVLVFVGFATKAGAMPFHSWLPRAHPVAPSHVSAVMSGAMIKCGIYGMVRLMIDVVGGTPDWLALLILGIGAVSAVMGVLYAVMQHDIKRLLAYHSIENIGIILIGLGSSLLLASHGSTALAAVALTAALFHSINHAVFKTLLFLCAGAVIRATGLHDLNHLGGLGRKMPVTMVAFGIGAAAISGLPPLNGFASEWLTFQGLFGAAGAGGGFPFARFAAALAIGALALTTALAVACFVKATGVAFLGLPRSKKAAEAHETSVPALAAISLLAAACLGLGLAAGFVTTSLAATVRTVLSADPTAASAAGSAAVTSGPRDGGAATYAALAVGLLLLVAIAVISIATMARVQARRVDTWACGIEPKPAFQYTATAYAKPIRLFFRRVLVPEREVRVEYQPGTAFLASIHYRSEITLLLEDRVLKPAHRLSLRGADFVRKLQGGAIQLYVAYIVVAVIALMLWAR
ncbi:MAG TPA: proton-conducting transporter membrane subunit [Candidatus Limnocylindrales bacterium]